MRFSSIVLILIILQGTIMLYDGLFYNPPDYCVGEDCMANFSQAPYNSTQNQTMVWDFITKPFEWSQSALIVALLLLGGTVGSFLFIGVIGRTPTDVVFFSPLFGIIVATGFIPIVGLANVIFRDPEMFGCTVAQGFCLPAFFIWLFSGGILAIFFVLSAIEFWRTGTS